MSESVVSSSVRRKQAAQTLAVEYEALSDEEVTEQVLSMHKPSANPVVRLVWVVLGSVFVVFAGIGVLL
ncbi:MAG: hypothetical protein ACPG7K_04990, partial [Poseidonia sp.]